MLIANPPPALAGNDVHKALNISAFLKGLIAAAAGTAAFIMLTKVQVPVSLISGTSLQLRSCLLVFIAVYCGPVSALIVGFAGHAASDALFYGGVWWSWVIADGLGGLALGFMAQICRFKYLTSSVSAACLLYVMQFIANSVSWAILAPLLDIVMYGEDSLTASYQGLVAASINVVLSAIVCTPVAALAANARRKRGDKAVPVWDC